MKPKMTRADGLAFKERWRLVNEFQRQELRAMTMEEKVRQLELLMLSARGMGWTQALAEADWEEHQLWLEVCRKWRGRPRSTKPPGGAAA